MGISKYRGSIYALSMFIHYPKHTHRFPNINPGLIVGEVYIRKDIWVSLQGAYIRRGLIFGGKYSGFYGILLKLLLIKGVRVAT